MTFVACQELSLVDRGFPSVPCQRHRPAIAGDGYIDTTLALQSLAPGVWVLPQGQMQREQRVIDDTTRRPGEGIAVCDGVALDVASQPVALLELQKVLAFGWSGLQRAASRHQRGDVDPG